MSDQNVVKFPCQLYHFEQSGEPVAHRDCPYTPRVGQMVQANQAFADNPLPQRASELRPNAMLVGRNDEQPTEEVEVELLDEENQPDSSPVLGEGFYRNAISPGDDAFVRNAIGQGDDTFVPRHELVSSTLRQLEGGYAANPHEDRGVGRPPIVRESRRSTDGRAAPGARPSGRPAAASTPMRSNPTHDDDEPSACRAFLNNPVGAAAPATPSGRPGGARPAPTPPPSTPARPSEANPIAQRLRENQRSSEQQWRTKRYKLPSEVAGVVRKLRPLGFLAPLHQDANGTVSLSQIQAALTELELAKRERRYEGKPEAQRAAKFLFEDLSKIRRNPGRYAVDQQGGYDQTRYTVAERQKMLGMGLGDGRRNDRTAHENRTERARGRIYRDLVRSLRRLSPLLQPASR